MKSISVWRRDYHILIIVLFTHDDRDAAGCELFPIVFAEDSYCKAKCETDYPVSSPT